MKADIFFAGKKEKKKADGRGKNVHFRTNSDTIR